MNPKTCLMMAAAVLLIVYNVMNKDGSVSQIAEMDQAALATRTAAISDMSGFSKDAELAVVEENADLVDPEQRQRAAPDPAAPVIGAYAAAQPQRTATLARVERPAHHNLKPGQDTMAFNPTIR